MRGVMCAMVHDMHMHVSCDVWTYMTGAEEVLEHTQPVGHVAHITKVVPRLELRLQHTTAQPAKHLCESVVRALPLVCIAKHLRTPTEHTVHLLTYSAAVGPPLDCRHAS